MSKHIALIAGLACLTWVGIWSWWLSKEHVKLSSAYISVPVTFNISDKDFDYAAAGIFSFERSDHQPIIPADNYTLLKALSRYLGENPGRVLLLSGKYLPDERNRSPYPNLGVARSTAIKNLLIKEGGEEDQIEVEGIMVNSDCLLEGRMIEAVRFTFYEKPDESQPDWNKNDEPQTASVEPVKEQAAVKIDKRAHREATTPEQIYFLYKDGVYALEKGNGFILDSLGKDLLENPDKKVIISGFSFPGEEAKMDGNLAERRARVIRRYLIDAGVERRQVIVQSNPGVEGNARVEITLIK